MVQLAVPALVIVAAWLTASVNAWAAFGRTPFTAVNVIACGPPVPAAGVPLNVPVPSALATKVTPAGSVPVTLSVGVGTPSAATVKVPGVPAVKVVVSALVNVGDAFTVSVKFWIADPLPLAAVKVSA